MKKLNIKEINVKDALVGAGVGFAVAGLAFGFGLGIPFANKKTSTIVLHSDVIKILHGLDEFGQRLSTTSGQSNKDAVKYISDTIKYNGLDLSYEHFSVENAKDENKTYKGQNIFGEYFQDKEKTLIIGAHYDTNVQLVGTDATGFTDNTSGVAGVLGLAGQLGFYQPKLDFNILLALWDVEEWGLYGSKDYVESFSEKEISNTVGYINLDTIAGGDSVYIHSAPSGEKWEDANSETAIRDALIAAGTKIGFDTDTSGTPGSENQNFNAEGFNFSTAGTSSVNGKAGEGYPASDFVPFAKAGIETASFESTNYSIQSEWGTLWSEGAINDGYVQTVHEDTWGNIINEDAFVRTWKGTKNLDASVSGFSTAGAEVSFTEIGALETELITYYQAEVAAGEFATQSGNNYANQIWASELYGKYGFSSEGQIWHTELDSKKILEDMYGTRIYDQTEMVTDTTWQYILDGAVT